MTIAGALLACGLTSPVATASAVQPTQGGTAEAAAQAHPYKPPGRPGNGRPDISLAAQAFDASPAGKALLTGEEKAQATALATHKAVTVPAATTPTSILTAEPGGGLQETTTLQPTRYSHNGAWVTTSTVLHRTKAGWAAKSVPGSVVLSAGGKGAAVIATNAAGQRTVLSFPGTLGSPVISGSTATYRVGTRGQVLTLTVTPQGGVTESLTLPGSALAQRPSPIGAATPALASDLGTWTGATPTARRAFTTAAPSVIPASLLAPPATGRAATGASRSDAVPAVTVAQDAVIATTEPDCTPGASDGQDCEDITGQSGAHYTDVEEWENSSSSGLWDTDLTNGEPVGNNVYGQAGGECSEYTSCLAQALFQIPLNHLNSSMYPYSSALYETETDGSDNGCDLGGNSNDFDPWSVSLWTIQPISAASTWDSHPGNIINIGTNVDLEPAYDHNGGSPCPSSVAFSFDITSQIQSAAANNQSAMDFKFVGDQATSTSGDPSGLTDGPCAGGDNASLNGLSNLNYNCGYMRIDNNPEIVTDYDLVPPAPTLTSITPTLYDAPGDQDTSCGESTQTAYVNQASSTLEVTLKGNWASEGGLKAGFTLEDANGNTLVSGLSPGGSGGASGAQEHATSAVVNGDSYNWIVDQEVDGNWNNETTSGGPVISDGSLVCGFTVDTSAPNLPSVTGVTTNSNGSLTLTLSDTETQPTGCGFSPCFDSGVYEFEYNENSNQFPNTFPTSCTASTSSSPSSSGCVLASGLSSSSPAPEPADDPASTQIISTATLASQGSYPSTSVCLDDYQDSTSAGHKVDAFPCNGSAAQKWTDTNGELQVVGTSVCLDPSGDATTAGTPIVIEPCSNDSPGETWSQNTYGSWLNSNSGLCLTIPSTIPGTQLDLASCPTSTSDPLQNWSGATATLTVPAPANWGVNTIYLKAETTAGVPTSSYVAYTFWVPPPSTPGVQGDITGDAIPDILATASNGNLYVYPGESASDALASPESASSSSSWSNYLITHRGSSSARDTDDLFAYNTTTNDLYDLADGDTQTSQYSSTNLPYSGMGNPLPVPTDGYQVEQGNLSSGNMACPDENLWSECPITQMLAVSNPDGISESAVNAPPSGLFTIQDNDLWYYPTAGGALQPPDEVGDDSWAGMTLLSPGYEGTETSPQLVLWARNNSTGALYAYTCTPETDDNGNTYCSLDGATENLISATGSSATELTLPKNVPALTEGSFPSITTAGDGAEPATLYVTESNGDIYALQGNPNPPASDITHGIETQPFQGSLTQVGTLPSGVTALNQIS